MPSTTVPVQSDCSQVNGLESGPACPRCLVEHEQQIDLKQSTCVSHNGIVSCSFCPECGFKSSSTASL